MAVRLKTNPSTVGTKSNDNIGAYHMISPQQSHLYEPQRTNNFMFVVTGLNNINKVGNSNKTIPNAEETITVSVESAFIPHFSQGTLPVKRGNSTIKFAGVPEFRAGQITLNDWIGVGVKDTLMAWQNMSYNVQTEKVGLVSDYKKQCWLVDYSPDYQIVRKWVLEGCWISEISEDTRNNESNNLVKIQATIEYDKAYLDTTEDI